MRDICAFRLQFTKRKIADEVMREQMATIHRANARLQIQRVELENANRRLEDLATTDGLESFIAEADQALYRSKRNGRNRVTHAADAFTSRK